MLYVISASATKAHTVSNVEPEMALIWVLFNEHEAPFTVMYVLKVIVDPE